MIEKKIIIRLIFSYQQFGRISVGKELYMLVKLRKLLSYLLFVATLIITVHIYQKGLDGPFLFDDAANIVANEKLRMDDLSAESLSRAAYSMSSGPFGRPLSMLSFAANFYIERGIAEPFPTARGFKLTNLAVHLTNGLLVFLLTYLVVTLHLDITKPNLRVGSPCILATAVAGAWLVHPFNLSTVLYVVQRMTSLAAFFTLVGLVAYSWGRQLLVKGHYAGVFWVFFSIVVCTPLAVLSKENGLLLPLYLLALEVFLFQFKTHDPRFARILMGVFGAGISIVLVTALLYRTTLLSWVTSAYAYRDFNLTERLMTEARVLWFYMQQIIIPDNSLMGLYHDDIVISRGLLDPASTIFSAVGLGGLLVLMWLLRKRQPLVAFGIAFFLCGHVMESTILPLELVHEHRNYLPSYGLLLALFAVILDTSRNIPLARTRHCFAFLIISLFAFCTYLRAESWSSEARFWAAESDHHPNSVRANMGMGNYHASTLFFDPLKSIGSYEMARQYYQRVVDINPSSPEGYFGLLILCNSRGLPVENEWLIALEKALSTQTLPANTNELLIKLMTCGNGKTCQLGADAIEHLLQAPLRNEKVVGRMRALIYSAQTYYFFHIQRDFPKALVAAQHGLELEPYNIDNRLWLVLIYDSLDKRADALAELKAIRQSDPSGSRNRDISLIEQQLTDVQ